MKSVLGKLLEIGSTPFATGAAGFGMDPLDTLGACGSALREVLIRKNGFFCFESALRVFPAVTTASSWGLDDWNSHELWKTDYQGLADDYFCFGEDIFGVQFCIAHDEIVIFDPESAEVRKFASTLDEWAAKILIDYNVSTGYRIAHEWQKLHGPLPARHRLMPKTPFVLGGDYALANLVAIDSVRLMKNMGNLAHQIYRLADGTKIQFKLTAPPEVRSDSQ